jgi:hypothetical protein
MTIIKGNIPYNLSASQGQVEEAAGTATVSGKGRPQILEAT